ALSSGWGSPSPANAGGVNAAGVPVGGAGDDCAAGGKSEDGPWGLGIPPPGGGGISVSGGGVDSSADMEEAGHASGDGGHDGWESDEGDREKGSSTEQLLQDAFANLSLHEKCALSLHVSHQQQGAAGKDAGAGVGKDASELSGIPKELAGVEERGLREEDLRAIMSMMGPSDLSEVEDEVKVIQQNFRAWILRCNYKSLRKAAKTLQVAWRERQKQRTEEGGPAALSSPASLTRMSLFQGMGGGSVVGFGSNSGDNKSALTVDGGGGPEPMDETKDD
ncbi:unnamed protein product, partial [Ectocarpus fasciculatus]